MKNLVPKKSHTARVFKATSENIYDPNFDKFQDEINKNGFGNSSLDVESITEEELNQILV